MFLSFRVDTRSKLKCIKILFHPWPKSIPCILKRFVLQVSPTNSVELQPLNSFQKDISHNITAGMNNLMNNIIPHRGRFVRRHRPEVFSLNNFFFCSVNSVGDNMHYNDDIPQRRFKVSNGDPDSRYTIIE
jgi:hypothetical protein